MSERAKETDQTKRTIERIRVAPPSLTIEPIGFVRAGELPKGMAQKFVARHQPSAHDQAHYIQLNDDPKLRSALKDLHTFSHIWIVWWFHLNKTWRPEVLPPRGPAKRRGVFATRSPYRPNPLGISAVELRHIDGLRLYLGACDAVDGTPVFDIRPYVPEYDSFPDASAGWIGEVNALLERAPMFRVELAPRAKAQLAWLADTWSINFQTRMIELLGRDPEPHRTRRIKRLEDGRRRMDCGAWRVYFTVQDAAVTVSCVTPGFPLRVLQHPEYGDVPDGEAQLAFLREWPD